MLLGEELVHGLERFQLADDARQSGTIVMDFSFFHPPLMLRVVEELEDSIQRLFRVVEHVREGATLPIFQKVLPRESNFGHRLRSSIDRAWPGKPKFARTNIAHTIIVSSIGSFCKTIQRFSRVSAQG